MLQICTLMLQMYILKMYKMDIRCDDLRCLVRISYVDKNIEL